MTGELLALGASHKTAPLALREKLALPAGRAARVLGTVAGGMPGSMLLTFMLSLVAMTCLFVTLWKYELASKYATFRLRALKRKLAGDEELWAPNPRRSAAPQL